jgi:hypothetical protein
MRRLRLPLAAALVLLLASCGGPVFYLQIVIPEVHVSLPRQSFPASTGAPPTDWCTPADPTCLFTNIEYDFGDKVPLLGQKHVTVDLRLTQLGIVLDAGTADLRGVKSVTVRLVNPDDATDSVVAASYVRTALDPNPTTISVSGNANVDLGAYLTGSKLVARAELVYDDTTPAFTADVAAEFSFVLTLDYGAYLF